MPDEPMGEKMVEIYKRPRLKEPILIAAWPGMGAVASKACDYLKSALGAEGFARLDQVEFFHPTGILIKKGLIEVPKPTEGKFYYWKNRLGAHDLIIFISELQPSIEKGYEYAHKILELAEGFGVKLVYTFAAMPVPIDHTQLPNVWATATNEKLLKELERHHVRVMGEGQISGLNGLLLGVARERGLGGICLLGELPLYAVQIENPRSSLVVLRVFTESLDLKLDLGGLEEQAKHMEEQIAKLVDYLKAPEHMGPIQEEEIERIKKELSAYTKLPKSAREKIEGLFKEARRDISRAHDLKRELDNWGVYKEYEDKFLDLFRHEKKGKRGEDLG